MYVPVSYTLGAYIVVGLAHIFVRCALVAIAVLWPAMLVWLSSR